MVALTALPSSPSDSSLPGKGFWVRQAACIPAKGMHSRGISTDGHWDSERLWPASGLQGSWNPVSSLCCYQQLCQWSFLQSPLAFIVPSQARCCATPVGNGMRKLIFFHCFCFGLYWEKSVGPQACEAGATPLSWILKM